MDIFWTIVIVLVILWLLGFIANIGGFIHILLVIALIVIVYRLVTGKNVVTGR
ncbi:MAG: hypothetical protein QG670_413 [Thermoproteota archaeon]|nr:hypothetical protein [Thermoproteota archaeon]